ncbi:hypothetical protein [Marinobacter salarius]
MSRFLILLFVTAMSGCAAQSEFVYYDPNKKSPGDQSVVVKKTFDEAWNQLVRHVSQTFFSINNFEKDSGLMIIDFSAQPNGEYVDCGVLGAKWVEGYRPQNFTGNYAEYLSIYQGGKINGRANITIRSIDETTTEVRINSKYVLSSTRNTWSFTNKTADTLQVQTPKGLRKRTCVATGKFEGQLLDAF